MDPLDLLPPELWRMIFEQVKDGQDWLNLYRASPSFQDVVGDERPRALLPQVFPHVGKFLESDLNGMLDLRLVSKQWKEVVDKSLVESSANGIQHNFTKCELKYQFDDSEEISIFLDKFSTHPGNPLVGSSVLILSDTVDTEEEATEYRNSVMRLMEKCGSQIRKLYISASNQDEATTGAFDNLIKLLISCVQRAPNLERLDVEFSDSAKLDYPEETENNLNLLLGNHQPLPIISSLKFLVFTGYGKRNSLINLQNIIVRMCCKPETLKGAAMIGIPRELSAFTSLEEVEVTWTANDDNYCEDERLQLAAMPPWPLSRLTWYLGYIVPLGDVVECVGGFKETLTSLEIDHLATSEEDLQCRLDLPRLRQLSISFRERNFDLLTNLINLELLHVVVDMDEVDGEKEIQQLSADLEREMLEINVWKALPKLAKIKLTGSSEVLKICKVYFREKYESRLDM